MKHGILSRSLILGSALMLAALDPVIAGKGKGNGEEPLELLINFDIVGTPVGPGLFEINGPGYASITTSDGEILDGKHPGLKVAELSGAQIQFQGAFTDPIVSFTCLPGSCTITLDDGSVLQSDDRVPLDGRFVSAQVWGLVPNSELEAGLFPQRILGCGGLQGVSGPKQGMVGSICFNGVFNVPSDLGTNPAAVLTGGSKCTIVLHHPVFPPM